jgi:hypothetical protein
MRNPSAGLSMSGKLYYPIEELIYHASIGAAIGALSISD